MDYLKHRDLCEKLAAAYVLGTLRGPAARRFARLAATHATVALMVAEWEARLTPIAAAVDERAPPASLWRKVAARIAAQERKSAPGLWTSLAFWRGLGAAGSAAAVALLAVLVLRPPELVEVRIPYEVVKMLPPKNEIPPSYLAVLEDPKTHKPVLLAIAGRNSNQLVVKAVDERPVASGRELELWALPPGAKPRSLGVIGTGGNARLTLASVSDSELGSIPMLAVSVEPKADRPPARPPGRWSTRGPATSCGKRGAVSAGLKA
ncbi:MAG: anti-sigma factor [Rhodospirillales bacterium]